MPPADRTAPPRFSRRGVIAGSALGLSALGVAGLSAMASRKSGAVHVADPALAGPLGDVWVGSPRAPVTLVEYAALTCSHCAAFHNKVWPGVRSRWVDTGKMRFVLRGFPLNPLDMAAFMLARTDGGRNY